MNAEFVPIGDVPCEATSPLPSDGSAAQSERDREVHINGELWEARSTAEADVGETVIVRAISGLTLLVEPSPGLGSSHRDDVGADSVRFPNGHYKRKETHGHK